MSSPEQQERVPLGESEPQQRGKQRDWGNIPQQVGVPLALVAALAASATAYANWTRHDPQPDPVPQANAIYLDGRLGDWISLAKPAAPRLVNRSQDAITHIQVNVAYEWRQVTKGTASCAPNPVDPMFCLPSAFLGGFNTMSVTVEPKLPGCRAYDLLPVAQRVRRAVAGRRDITAEARLVVSFEDVNGKVWALDSLDPDQPHAQLPESQEAGGLVGRESKNLTVRLTPGATGVPCTS